MKHYVWENKDFFSRKYASEKTVMLKENNCQPRFLYQAKES